VSEPLRVLFLDEGVLGHRTMTEQLRETLAGRGEVEATFATVPPPNRLERLLLRQSRLLGGPASFELRWRLRWSWRARRLLKRHARSVDAAFVTTQASALLMRGPMRRLPCVLSVDATVAQFAALEYGGPDRRPSPRQLRLLERLERRAVTAAAAVVAWTEWNARGLRDGYGLEESKLAVVHPGLDVARWEAAAKRRQTPAAAAPLRVLFVGNDVERKGLGVLAEAVERLAGQAVLDVVSGDEVAGSELVRVHRDIEARSEALLDLYTTADALALPTRADAVPWSALEAMAAGLPVVASGVGAVPELLGDAGILVAPGSVEEVEAALRRLANDPDLRRRLGERALTRARERYDVAVQAPKLLAVLRDAAAATQTGRRFRRRTFVAAGAGVAAVAAVTPYALLIPDDEFARLVASTLGVSTELAEQLLDRAREEYGEASYDAHAAAFALAVRGPASAVLPQSTRERAIEGLVEPMLSAPASNLAYAITGSDPGAPAPCSGLMRDE
jgi:glycosyltransferase involved in cell wall biosynthesis